MRSTASVVETEERAEKFLCGTFHITGRWLIEAIILEDSSENKRGLLLRRRIFYATAQARSGYEMFHPIQWEGNVFSGALPGRMQFPKYALPYSTVKERKDKIPECVIPPLQHTRQDMLKSSRNVIAGHVWGFLERHPGTSSRGWSKGMRKQPLAAGSIQATRDGTLPEV